METRRYIVLDFTECPCEKENTCTKKSAQTTESLRGWLQISLSGYDTMLHSRSTAATVGLANKEQARKYDKMSAPDSTDAHRKNPERDKVSLRGVR